MPFFKNLYDQPFIRFTLNILGLEPFFRKPQKEFIPYFQYKLESYRPDYYLYFPRMPNANTYMHELFRKLSSYSSYELTRFLDFHYLHFAEKKEFLRFLHYEIAAPLQTRTAKTKPTPYWQTLQTCLLWINEQQTAFTPPTPSEPPAPPTPPAEAGIGNYIEMQLADGIEPRMAEIARSFAGRITLNDHHHLVKITQVLLLLKELRAPGKKIQPLFKDFSTTDLAAILRQFEEYRDKKVNTIQINISDCNKTLNPSDPATRKLIKALTDFIY